MDKDILNTPEWSQDDLIIKILEFVCNNKELKAIPAPLVQRDLFPFMSENEILHLFAVIKQRDIPQITVVPANHLCLKYERGLEQYIKSLDTKTEKEKLHRIVEFLTIESEKQDKKLFESDEIAKAFIPELSIHEVNRLCRKIMNEEDVNDAPTDQAFNRNMLSIVVTPRTRSAYQSNKYLEIDEQVNTSINHPIFNVHNLSYVGHDNSGKIEQEVKSESSKKVNGKPKWLKVLGWILAVLVAIAVIIEGVIKISKLF